MAAHTKQMQNLPTSNPNTIKQADDLLQWTRFDIAIKYLYGLSLKQGWNTNYYRNMYSRHIKIWNNYNEYDNPLKNSEADYLQSFATLLNSIKADGFKQDLPPVPICRNRYPLNGAHRIAACMLYDKDVLCMEGEDRIDGQLDCSWSFFAQRDLYGRLEQTYADRAAIEFANKKKNSRMVIVYPSAVKMGRLGEVEKIITQYGGLIYYKDVALNTNGAINIMRELYHKEEWAEANHGMGYENKARLCFPAPKLFGRITPARVYLLDFEEPANTVDLKNEIRSIYKIGKHSIHTNDTHEETIRLAKCFFNTNSIHFINNAKRSYCENFEHLLAELTGWINQNRLDIDNFCISAGSVLTAYGIKSCKDLDYLHFDQHQYPGNQLIQSHNDYGANLYHTHRDDIIFNPDNHFYRFGIKFSSLSVVKKLKLARKEDKDIKDLRLMKKIHD